MYQINSIKKCIAPKKIFLNPFVYMFNIEVVRVNEFQYVS